jgi:hypothetical protein
MSEVWLDSNSWSYNPHSGNVLNERFKGKKFDSYFGKNSHPTQNHSLKIYLRVYLKPINNQTSALDSKKRRFPVKNWTPDEWLNFTTQFERQSYLWNNRFWLIPPKYFSLMDVKFGGRTIRPNIHCFLFTEVTNSPGNAHRTIDVVNLDVETIKKQRHINPGSGTFKSNAHHIDSLDIKPRDISYEDDQGVEHTIKNHYTIAHELGHAIGLEHIGVLKSRPQCTFAISLKKHGIKNVSSHLARGANAEVCYGEFDSLGLAENIMGLGTKFEEVNAQPWLDRVEMHTNTNAADWKVLLAPVSPKAVF